ncbi:MAG: hypothetical protein MUF81_11155 [Verrucomicrobia bacterium]|jgi:hypothetical protein|nr:hypothetical protein [Verrucomicrobiota bacterium]
MKPRFFKKVSFGLALSAMPFVGACNQQTSNPPQSIITTAQAEPSVAATSNAVTSTGDLAGPTAPETTPPPPESGPVPAPAPNSGKTLPPNIKPSSPLGEVVKLAQSGVDESVMLSYVKNSASMFNLASDEIIYLNDIGTPNSVVTAMIQRDQALKQSWTDAAQAQNATAQANPQAAQGAAPTYANPPQPEPQPAQTVEATAPPAPQAANVTYNYFYDTLSPYGSWIEIDGYGRCWQPTVVVVNRGWQPYGDRGRWLYTDAGWYWNSDYSWGATTFHYGRWFNHARWGWCWWPDTVWGPSWVSWRYSNDYCGWAPLPPAAYYRPGFGFSYHNRSVGFSFDFGLGASCYNFVPWGHFSGSRPWHHRASGTHVTQIYNNTTVINNIVTGDNNTIINRGVPIDHARRHAGTEIRQVAIRETRNADHGTRGERLERDGRTLVVHRPNIPQSAGDTTASPRHLRDSQTGRTPTAGAGAAAQVETPRSRGSDRIARTQPGTPPTVSSPRLAEGRTATQSPPVVSDNTRATPPQVNPSSGADRGTPRSRDERPDNSNRDRNRGNNRSSTTQPLMVQGGQQVTPTAPQSTTTVNTPVAQKPPSSSLVVVGRRDSNPGQNQTTGNERRSTSARTETPARSSHTWSANQPAPASQPSVAVPQVQTPRASATTPPGSLPYNRPTPQAPRYERQEAPRQVAPPSRTYSAPAPATPSPRPQSVAPTYSAPRPTPAPSQSAPIYSAPRSAPAPAPSYTPAPLRAPAAAPVQERSQSERNGSSRRNRD